jgi:hypothetical protein
VRRMRRSEAGQAGMEVIPFGLLTFVVGALVVANAWAVIDAKMAVSAAAREATRAFVEAPVDGDPLALADAAARSAIAAAGRDPAKLVLTPVDAVFARCETVRYEARYQVPAVQVPWVGGFGAGFTATARHAEVVDPYRSGLPPTVNGCVTSA